MNKPPYKHKEAFCLMWYACKNCTHKERYWNSRDGVTPFSTRCPSCGLPELYHVLWGEDMARPNHQPHHGQRIWVSATSEDVDKWAQSAIDLIKPPMNEHEKEGLRQHYRERYIEEPALRICGYDYFS
jgi:hypothetical protein